MIILFVSCATIIKLYKNCKLATSFMDSKFFLFDVLFEHIFCVKTAEEYLTETDHEGEVTDVESVVTEKSNTESELSSNYGKLKHSDSLLLLTQVSVFSCFSVYCF